MYRRFLSVRYFRTRLVNWLSVGGVMVGVAVMIVVWSVMAGFQTEVRAWARGMLSDLILIPDATQEVPGYEALDAQLVADPEVAATAPRAKTYVAYPWRTGGSWDTGAEVFHFMEAEGIDWGREHAVSAMHRTVVAAVDDSDPFKDPEAAYRESQTGMFSLAFLRKFVPGVPGDAPPAAFLRKVVDLVFVHQAEGAQGPEYARRSYRVWVSAVYDSRNHEEDERRVFFDRASLRDMAKIRPEYTEVRVATKTPGASERVRERLRQRVPGFDMFRWEDLKAGFLRAVNNEKGLLMIVLSFIILLAAFTILATLTLTVIEKTRDIGLVRAIGATTGGVLSVFLLGGLMIGVLGGLLGLGLGIVLTNNLNPFKNWLRDAVGIDLFPADIYLFPEIPTLFEWPAVFGIVVSAVVLALLAGLPPALRAARMDPVVALRHE